MRDNVFVTAPLSFSAASAPFFLSLRCRPLDSLHGSSAPVDNQFQRKIFIVCGQHYCRHHVIAASGLAIKATKWIGFLLTQIGCT